MDEKWPAESGFFLAVSFPAIKKYFLTMQFQNMPLYGIHEVPG